MNPREHLCLDGARVSGPIEVRPGGALSVVRAQVSGGVVADGATFVKICGSQVASGVNVRGSSVPVSVGDQVAGCAGNQVSDPGIGQAGRRQNGAVRGAVTG